MKTLHGQCVFLKGICHDDDIDVLVLNEASVMLQFSDKHQACYMNVTGTKSLTFTKAYLNSMATLHVLRSFLQGIRRFPEGDIRI